jgi:uncharacterized membrane protein
MALLALAGMGVASLLMWLYYEPTSPFCTGVGGCHTVATSPYAHIGPVPVALVGVLGYGAMALLALSRQPWAIGALMALSLGALTYSCYLTYLEVAVIHALCPWCLASQGLVAALAALSTLRFLTS